MNDSTVVETLNAFGGKTARDKRNEIGQVDDRIGKLDLSDTTSPVFGIDLGTTNSAISVITQGDYPKVIKLVDGSYTMPSCVMWHNNEFIVGREAYENRANANVIYSVKRFMQDPHKTVILKEGSRTLEMTPAEVSAEILKGLVEKTGGVYGDIKDVVVTVPAYFDQNGRNATRKACELAGLNLIDIINEPTAAALCYDIDESKSNGATDFITFDFGGGTLDITLARITGNDSSADSEMYDLYGIESDEQEEASGDSCKIIQCLAIEGDSHLGGDNIDKSALNILDEKVQQATGCSVMDFPRDYREELILRLEQMKKTGVHETYAIQIDSNTATQKVQCEIPFGYADFRRALMPVYKKCCETFDKLLAKTEHNADSVILVGGSTKHPILVEMLKEDYPEFTFSNSVDQDLAVSMGAAIKGKIDKFGSDTVQVFDILPISIGINANGEMKTAVLSGATLPASADLSFTNVYDNQVEMKLELLQGESFMADECVSLGVLTFKDIPPAPAESLQLSVRIQVDAKSKMTCIGIVNGERKVLELDLTGETAKPEEEGNANLTEKEKRLVKRWKAFAEGLDQENAAKLNDMISRFPATVSRKQISAFIAEHDVALKDADK